MRIWSKQGGKVHGLRADYPTYTYCGRQYPSVEQVTNGSDEDVTCRSCASWIANRQAPFGLDLVQRQPSSMLVDAIDHATDVPEPVFRNTIWVPSPSWTSTALVRVKKWSGRLVAAGIAGVVILAISNSDVPDNNQQPPLVIDSPSGDLDCADFSTHAEAQSYYDDQVGDPDGLDRDNDGSACELLP